MSEWIVYSKDGQTERCRLKKLEYSGSFMNERAVTSTFTSPVEVEFDVFDYIEYRGEQFELEAIPTVKKTSSFSYEYDLRFVSYKYELERCEMRDIVPHDNGIVYPTPLTFSFMGNVKYLAERIQTCLDAMYGYGVWNISIADGTTSDEHNITISQQNCWNALALVNTTYKLNFYIKGRTVTIGGSQPVVDHAFQYGKGNGLYEIERTSSTDTAIVTKLRAYGSTRNLDYSYPKRPDWSDSTLDTSFVLSPLRLMLPSFKKDGKTDYLMASDELVKQYGVREASIIYEDIYPSITGATHDGNAIDEIKSVEAVNDSLSTFVVYLHDLGFDLEEHLTNDTAQVSMKEGSLQGYTFNIQKIEKQDDGSNKLTLERITLSEGDTDNYNVPNSDWNMEAGDKFVLLNILMPQEYIRDAEERLKTRAEEYLAQYAKTNFGYSIGIHDKFLIENPSIYEELVEGSKLRIQDEELGISEDVTIQSITITENMEDNILPQVKVTLNNEPSASTLERIQGQINDLANGVSGSYSKQGDVLNQYRRKLDRPYFDKLFVAIDKDGKEIPSNDLTTEVHYILAKYHFATVGGVTMYTDDGFTDLPSIYAGLPIDNSSIYWEEVENEDGSVTRILKAKVGSGEGGSATLLGDLKNVGTWANEVAAEDRIMVQKKDSTTWTSLLLSEIKGTADFSNVKESGEGNAYTSFTLSEDKKTLTFVKGETFAKSSELSNKADKATTLAGYGITDAYTKTEVDGLLDKKWTKDDTKISNWDTAFGWGDHSKQGYTTKTYVDGKFLPLAGGTVTGNLRLRTGSEYTSPYLYFGDGDEVYLKEATDRYLTIHAYSGIILDTPLTTIDGIDIKKSEDGVLFIDANLVVSGGITMYGTDGTTSSSIWDGAPLATTGSTKGIASFDPSYFAVTNGVVTFIGSTGDSGGTADSVAWSNVTGKPSWIGSTKPSYTFSEIGSKPTTISGYGITDAKITNGVITLGANTITPLTAHQTIYNLTFQTGTFSAKTFDPNGAAQTVNIPTKTSHLTNDSNFITSSYVDGKFVTIAGSEDVTGVHNFTNGLKVGGIKLSKSQDGVIYLEGNLVVSGGITMFGTDSVTASTVMDGVLVDDTTIRKNPTTGKLEVIGGTGGGLDESALASYLTTNKYLTQTTGDARYVTALGTSGNYLTYTKNGATTNITVPYATTAKELTSYSAITFSKSDNSGMPCYLLIADVTSWYNVSSGSAAYGIVGFVYGYRDGATPACSMNVAARCAYGKGYYSLSSNLTNIIEPRIVSYNSKYYLALYLKGSNRNFNFIGRKNNLLSSFTELQCSDSSGTYSGLSVIYTGSATGTVSTANKLSTARTISLTGHATGSGSFDGSEDLGINVAIPTRNVYINGTGYTVHSTIETDTTGIYAPTSGGTSGYVLKANGATSIPTWVAQSSLSVGTASKLSTVSKTAWGQTYWTSGGVPTSISGDMSSVGNITFNADGVNVGAWSKGIGTLHANIISSGGSNKSMWLVGSSSSDDYGVVFARNTTGATTGEIARINSNGFVWASGVIGKIVTTGTELQLKYNNSDSQSVVLNATSFKPFVASSGNLTLGNVNSLWAGLYLGGGSMPNANGINFTDGSTYVVNQICGNSTGGIGVYSSGSIFLRGGCTKGTTNVTSSGTGVTIDASGNMLVTGSVAAGALSFGNEYYKSISSAGWYRFATSNTANNAGGTYVFFIRRNYYNTDNEAYIISCTIDYAKVHWSLLNGHANTRLITQVRCTYTNNGTIYFDLYYNGSDQNYVYVNAIGNCTLQAPASTSSTLTSTSVFGLGNGMIVDGNLLVKGGITMYATSSTSPISEFYASYLKVTGNMDIVGNINSTYYMLNNTVTNPYLKLTHSYNGTTYTHYVQGHQGYLYLGAGSANSLRISSDGSLYTPKTLTQGSDIRHKDIHKDILLPLTTMSEAPSIEFHFKDDEQKSTHIGTSAQYWQSVEGIVTEDSEGRLGMDYSSLGVVMGISLAKELSRFESDTDIRIRLLEEENEELRKEIDKLKQG